MKNILFLFAFLFSFSVCAQKPTRNIGREQTVPLSSAVGIPAIVDSADKKVGRLINPAEIATNANLSLKASQTTLSDSLLQIRSDLAVMIQREAVIGYVEETFSVSQTTNLTAIKTLIQNRFGSNFKDGWYVYSINSEAISVNTITQTVSDVSISGSPVELKNGWKLFLKFSNKTLISQYLYLGGQSTVDYLLGLLQTQMALKANSTDLALKADVTALSAEAATRLAADNTINTKAQRSLDSITVHRTEINNLTSTKANQTTLDSEIASRISADNLAVKNVETAYNQYSRITNSTNYDDGEYSPNPNTILNGISNTKTYRGDIGLNYFRYVKEDPNEGRLDELKYDGDNFTYTIGGGTPMSVGSQADIDQLQITKANQSSLEAETAARAALTKYQTITYNNNLPNGSYGITANFQTAKFGILVLNAVNVLTTNLPAIRVDLSLPSSGGEFHLILNGRSRLWFDPEYKWLDGTSISIFDNTEGKPLVLKILRTPYVSGTNTIFVSVHPINSADLTATFRSAIQTFPNNAASVVFDFQNSNKTIIANSNTGVFSNLPIIPVTITGLSDGTTCRIRFNGDYTAILQFPNNVYKKDGTQFGQYTTTLETLVFHVEGTNLVCDNK